METIDSIMAEMERRVIANEPISPASWCESAMRINLLADSLDNELAHFEAELNSKEAEYIRADMPAARAKKLARAEVDYEGYLKLKARVHRLQEWILLAKKRAVIEDNNF